MKRSIKTLLVALALVACLACLVWLGSRLDEPDEKVRASVSDTSRGPSFEVRVVVPWLGRPLSGILPDWVVVKFDGTPSELRFDHTSRGAQIGRVGHDRVELKADDWTSSLRPTPKGGSPQERASCFRWLSGAGS